MFHSSSVTFIYIKNFTKRVSIKRDANIGKPLSEFMAKARSFLAHILVSS